MKFEVTKRYCSDWLMEMSYLLNLQESGDLLKIEDILPFFPDFVTIDHFKDALCESLSEYNKSIEHLKVTDACHW